jgi:hypothetical protein
MSGSWCGTVAGQPVALTTDRPTSTILVEHLASLWTRMDTFRGVQDFFDGFLFDRRAL